MNLTYLKDFDSKVSAIQVLQALDWNYLSPEEALALRNGRKDGAILSEVLKAWLAKHNHIEIRNTHHQFSEANIQKAIQYLADVPYNKLMRTNEKIYNLLTLGCTLDQTIGGECKGRSLRYIDWDNPNNNVFHMADEFIITHGSFDEVCRPDIVLFINGIPLVVIECKHNNQHNNTNYEATNHAIEQLIGYQKENKIPQLFQYAQLLLGASVDSIQYGTVGTSKKFWTVWKEKEITYKKVPYAVANQALAANIVEKLFTSPEEKHMQAYQEVKQIFEQRWTKGNRQPTAQDNCLWAMLRHNRLLDFIYGFLVFNEGVHKIAHYQQFFTVNDTLKQVSALQEGQRTGGVIWHAASSGKFLTMLMLSKALVLQPNIENARVIIVTDRMNTNEQIRRTLEACGKSVVTAKTGEHLVRAITQGKTSVITTPANKFMAIMSRNKVQDISPNIFVLVDEDCHLNYGVMEAMVRRVFPKACYLSFTGTPPLKKDKSTVEKLGGFIHTYTMREAVKDKVITPVFYEERMAQFKNNIAGQRLRLIALDVLQHYKKNFQGAGFKAQLVAGSQENAIFYHQIFNELGGVNTEVVMSKSNLHKVNKAIESRSTVENFWSEIITSFGSKNQYLKKTLASFGRENGVEIIIGNELFTSINEPRNTILYIDKPLKEHEILQSIAQVNHLYTGKKFGFIIDYKDVFGALNKATNTYDALHGFDTKDVDLRGVIINSRKEISQLPQRHSHVWSLFDNIENKNSTEFLEQYLVTKNTRQEFYLALREYQNLLAVAFTTNHFHEDAPKQQVVNYKNDLKFFCGLRHAIQHRYAEIMDESQYEKQLARVINAHVQAPNLGIVTKLVNIFNTKAFDKEIEQLEGNAAKASTIAYRLKKTMTEKMEENPAFYKKLADLVQQVMDNYQQKHINAAEFLSQIKKHLQTVRYGHNGNVPEELNGHAEAQAFYGVVNEVLGRYEIREPYAEYKVKGRAKPENSVAVALQVELILNAQKIRDWPKIPDVIKSMHNELDDYLFELNMNKHLNLKTSDIDEIIEGCIAVARKLTGA